MAMGEAEWRERAQSAEAKLTTYSDSIERMKEEVRDVREFFGARKLGSGGYDIDFAAFVERLGVENALQVRAIIDEHYGISGQPGEKPRMKVKAA